MSNNLSSSSNNTNSNNSITSQNNNNSTNNNIGGGSNSKSRKLDESNEPFLTTVINTLPNCAFTNLKSVVLVPDGVDQNEWIAINGKFID